MARTADLTLDDFALFARVAELRNLSAVARERDVPPSQVSRALARIERLCGARLVHRSTHGLSLSDEGQSLAAHGAQLLAVALELDGALDERRADPSGLVRLASSPVLAIHLLPALAPLLERHPRLRLEIAADDRLVDMAREGIDVAIRTGEPQAEGLVARPIGEHSRALFAAPAYLARHGTPAHPDELAGHRLIANSASPALNRWPFELDGQPQALKVAGTLRSDNTAVTLAMTLAGLGIARLNRVIVAPHVAEGRLVPVLERHVVVQTNAIYAVMLPERQRLPKVRACVDHLAAWFAGAG
ncbi:LysR family transcriptional regulator [Piscinibacter sakaiensis]|uniref:Transcriptional regulator, LysR family n=1 Tax=Piscinibacter sakaiensis TaxID=1547922 RepID=A0A0K8P0G6_PISS1|nr:LysR family transcriptional regulator [Piscinibacter sakaiensis]GAP36126.1 transcriptional regulator, LysR family [Piscinibacter sakaiensis]